MRLIKSIIERAYGHNVVANVSVFATVSVECDQSNFDDSKETPQEKVSRVFGAFIPSWVDMSFINRIRNLKCYEMVRLMCSQGVKHADIATQIQNNGELLEVKHSTVVMYLAHFTQTLPKIDKLYTIAPAKYNEIRKEFDRGEQCLRDLEKIRDLAIKRLEIAYEREKSIGMLLPGVEKAYAIAIDSVERLQQMSSKLVGERPVESGADISTSHDYDSIYGKKGLNKAMSSVQSKLKVAKFVEKVLERYGAMPDEKLKEIEGQQVEYREVTDGEESS